MPLDPSAYAPTAPPTVPDRTNRTSFATQMYNFFTWMAQSTAGGLYYAIANLPGNVYSNAVEVYNAATTRALSNFKGIYAGGTTYAQGDTVYVTGSGYYISNVGSNLGNAPASSPTQWSPVSLGNRSGGASVTPVLQTVLVAGSAQVQKFAPTTPGQSVKLPDATGCQMVTSPYFIFQNAGTCDLKILDNASTIKGFVPAGAVCAISLYDNTTAAGGWGCANANTFGVTASLEYTAVAFGAVVAAAITTVTLDANRTAIFIQYTGTTNRVGLYVVVFDASAAIGSQWGTPTLVTADTGTTATTGYTAALIATDKIVVSYTDTVGASRLHTLVVSFVGLVPTANAVVNTGLANTLVFWSSVLVGSTVCVAANDGATVKIWGVTVSGTVPTIGTAVSPGSVAGACDLYANGSSLFAILEGTATTIQGTPYTVAGTVLTVGTSASPGAFGSKPGGLNTTMRTMATAAGWLAVMTDVTATFTYAHYFTVAGTVASQSTVTLNAASTVDPRTTVDMQNIVGNGKVLIAISGGSVMSLSVLTFTGSAAATSNLTLGAFTGNGAPYVAPCPSGTTGKVMIAGTSSVRTYSVDTTVATASGTTVRTYIGAQDLTIPTLSSPRKGRKAPASPASGSGNAIAIPTWATGAFSKRSSALALAPTREWVIDQDPLAVGVAGDTGASNAESWLIADYGAAQANGGLYLQRIEMAS
jgi:hypothetical protein